MRGCLFANVHKLYCLFCRWAGIAVTIRIRVRWDARLIVANCSISLGFGLTVASIGLWD